MIKIFSFWIFIWFLLYYFGFTKYNPLFLLLLISIFPFIQLIYFIKYKVTYYNFFKFLMINLMIKIIPILLIIKFPLKFKFEDIYISTYLILIYLILMIVLRVDIYTFYKEMIESYLYNYDKNKTLLSRTYDYLYEKL